MSHSPNTLPQDHYIWPQTNVCGHVHDSYKIHKNSIHKNGIFELSWLPLARYSGSCSWTCPPLRLCWVARSVSICFHYRMLALMLRLDFPVSGGLVEDNHHARTLEDSVFCHLVAVSVRVTFVYRRRHTFYPCVPLHVCHVWRSAWLAGQNSAWIVFPQMLEIVCDWRSLYARHTVAWEGMCQCFHQCINGDSISCRTAPPFQKITNVFFVKKHKTKTFDANMPNCTRSSELFAEKNSYRMQVFGDQI